MYIRLQKKKNDYEGEKTGDAVSELEPLTVKLQMFLTLGDLQAVMRGGENIEINSQDTADNLTG